MAEPSIWGGGTRWRTLLLGDTSCRQLCWSGAGGPQHGTAGLQAEIKAAIFWLHNKCILSPPKQKSGRSLTLWFAAKVFLHPVLTISVGEPKYQIREWKHTKGKGCKSPASSLSSHPSPSSNMPHWRKQGKAGSIPAASASQRQKSGQGNGCCTTPLPAPQEFLWRAAEVDSAAWQHEGAGRKV